MSNSQEQFRRRFLGDRIIVEEEPERVSHVDEAGILIISQPLYKAAALRLRKVFTEHVGTTPLYIELDNQRVLLGKFKLTFDSYTYLQTVLRPYSPNFYWVTQDTQEEFDSKTLISTAKLPPMEQRDYYIGG